MAADGDDPPPFVQRWKFSVRCSQFILLPILRVPFFPPCFRPAPCRFTRQEPEFALRRDKPAGSEDRKTSGRLPAGFRSTPRRATSLPRENSWVHLGRPPPTSSSSHHIHPVILSKRTPLQPFPLPSVLFASFRVHSRLACSFQDNRAGRKGTKRKKTCMSYHFSCTFTDDTI
jgi:hypothetical protein